MVGRTTGERSRRLSPRRKFNGIFNETLRLAATGRGYLLAGSVLYFIGTR